MKSEILQTEPREVKGSQASAKLRRQGKVPAVLYGRGAENVLLSVSLHDLNLALQHSIRVLDLTISGQNQKVIIKEVQYGSLGDEPEHVDFARVAVDEKVRVKIPIVLAGVPVGMEAGGILDHPVTDVEIEALPTEIPESIRVSIKALEIGDIVTVGDLEVPEGVTVVSDPRQVVATIHPPVKAVEVEEVVAAEGAVTEPEVIGAKEREEADKEAESE